MNKFQKYNTIYARDLQKIKINFHSLFLCFASLNELDMELGYKPFVISIEKNKAINFLKQLT